MRLAVYQFDVRRGATGENIASVERGLRQAADEGANCVVLPEMWPTSFPERDYDLERALRETEAALGRLAELSAELGLCVCGSAFAASLHWNADARPVNRLHVFDSGELVLGYDKVHLFTATAEHEVFSAGSSAPSVAETSVGRVAGVVCYDARFPEITRMPFLSGAELLLVPAQWPSPRAHHWTVLLRARAVENQCFVVAANRTGKESVGRRDLELEFPGNSLIADPDGELLAEGDGLEGLISAEVDLGACRRLATRVPIRKDRRADLYSAWDREHRPR